MKNNCICGHVEVDGWVRGYKVRVFPWIDGEHIYCNVRYFRPGQSMYKPPVWDRSVLIDDTESGRRFVGDYLDTLVSLVSSMFLAERRMGHLTIATDGSITISCASDSPDRGSLKKSKGKAATIRIYILE